MSQGIVGWWQYKNLGLVLWLFGMCGWVPPYSAYVVLAFALQRISSICFHKKKRTVLRFVLFNNPPVLVI
jgi:hypothetical protein